MEVKSTIDETGSLKPGQAKATPDAGAKSSQPFYKNKKVIVLSTVAIVACLAVVFFNHGKGSHEAQTTGPEPVITVTTEKVAPHVMAGLVQGQRHNLGMGSAHNRLGSEWTESRVYIRG